ncbi:MAG: hypothetical protein O8C66_12055 [Candidatus Methanoperedens sp.]|nr:hypothetical protein [Candidatus Methanoperedens sp.]MCZ7371235.1 hypothetical protein [Candidatus Methanoperedens sp.]
MKKMRSLSMALIFAMVMVSVMAQAAFASPSHPVFGTFVNDRGVPSGSKLILDISLKVTNDEDSGNVGYWALDNYNKIVQVWKVPDGSFYAVVKYDGKWQTFKGALSPGNGSSQLKDASGTFKGGYIAIFNGTFDPGTRKTKGSIGSFNFSGTKADILLGTYGAGQTGITPTFNYLSAYFTGVGDFAQPHWGWTYQYKKQAWYNYAPVDGGTSGDIVVT